MYSKNKFLLLILAFNFAFFVFKPQSYAIYDSTKNALYGNAEPVKKGDIYIGLFSPLLYGVKDSITLITHPILNLLLTPNFFLKINLFSFKRVSDSIEGGYVQTFIENSDGIYLGYGTIGNMITVYPFSRLNITLQNSYLFKLGHFSEHLINNLFCNLFITPKNILFFMISVPYSLTTDSWSTPYGKILYIRRFSSFIISGGLFINKTFFLNVPYFAKSFSVKFYPVIDMIWAF